MKLHNTLTRQVSDFKPLKEGEVGIYTCGPTLYDRVHIGNLNSFIVADLLRRALKAQGMRVQHVMNFTDVDDKTILASRTKYADLDPKEALIKLTAEHAGTFLEDMAAVGNDNGSFCFTNATDNILEMQELITALYEAGFAYVAEDGIYFSIEAYRKAGKTYGQLLEITAASTSHARVQNDEYDKDSAHDFVLWKAQKDGEPAWDFMIGGEWMNGRPGWHIECSAMSKAMLAEQFDIHTGGIDLVFPHHENEIAQSTALTSSPVYATTFVHNEHLLVDGKKMSKSLGNFYTLQDVKDKGFDPLAFRMLVLQSHYRNQTHFGWDNLEAAQNRLKDYRNLAVMRYQSFEKLDRDNLVNVADVASTVSEILSHDINTPGVLAYLSEISNIVKAELLYKGDLEAFEKMLADLDDMLGLQLSSIPDISEGQKALVEERSKAREAQDWPTCDRLREELLGQGIELRDTGLGTIWSLA